MAAQWAAESNFTRILAVTGTIHALALLYVGLRVYARVSLLRSPGRDDATIVVASVWALLSCLIHSLTQTDPGARRMDLLRFARLLWSWST
jgi:hypothetical protein